MTRRVSNTEIIEDALLEAGRTAAAPEPPGRWHSDVMRAVRQAAAAQQSSDRGSVVGHLVWKLAVPAGVAAFALLAFALPSFALDSYVADRIEMENTFEHMLAEVVSR